MSWGGRKMQFCNYAAKAECLVLFCLYHIHAHSRLILSVHLCAAVFCALTLQIPQLSGFHQALPDKLSRDNLSSPAASLNHRKSSCHTGRQSSVVLLAKAVWHILTHLGHLCASRHKLQSCKWPILVQQSRDCGSACSEPAGLWISSIVPLLSLFGLQFFFFVLFFNRAL